MSGSPYQPIAPVAAVGDAAGKAAPMPQSTHATTSFSQMLFNGVDRVSEKATAADALVKAFVLDDSIPPHRVLYALEQSRMSLQMMLQVRNRVVEGYQEIMRMQL